MGDILTLLNTLGLSPVNTVLLVLLLVVARQTASKTFARLSALEERTNKHRTSIAIVKNHLNITEDDD